jgi:hypothetical protein
MEDTIRDLKGTVYKLQLENLSPQQISAVKSVLQRSEITPALVASVVSAIQQADGQGQAGGCGCAAAGGGSSSGASIRTLAPVCPGAKMVGQVITLTSTPTGGTPGVGYTVRFRRGALPGTDLPNGTFTGVPEGSPRTMNYTLIAADSPSNTFSVYITDNCPTGALSNTESCVVTVGTCNVPACGFVVA